MKRSLSHLPAGKREEIAEVVRVIRDTAEVELVVLFGSYARGDWRDEEWHEGHVIYEYHSDYDLLVVVANRKKLWRNRLGGQLAEAVAKRAQGVSTKASIVARDIGELNQKLSDGECFYTEILKQGIVLYDSKTIKLTKARKLTPQERLKFAKRDFNAYYASATDFWNHFRYAFGRSRYKIGAFHLHQAVENYLNAVLLVYTRDRPRVHDLSKLQRLSASLDSRFLDVFPQGTDEERKRYRLLCEAYISARYDPNWSVRRADLAYLEKRVRKLRLLARKSCREKMDSFRGN